MIDFWEILGHVATDDPFRDRMYDTFAGKRPQPDATNKFACLFADQDYDTARGLVISRMGPVSLMALGEWLVVSMLHPESRPLLNTVSQISQRILNGYQSNSPLFYQALGVAIVDTGFRDAFNQGNEPAFGFRLQQADRDALGPLLADGGFSGQCGKFHDLNWKDSCKDMCIQNQNHPYAHALEQPFKP
jgi:hypothetical protein